MTRPSTSNRKWIWFWACVALMARWQKGVFPSPLTHHCTLFLCLRNLSSALAKVNHLALAAFSAADASKLGVVKEIFWQSVRWSKASWTRFSISEKFSLLKEDINSFSSLSFFETQSCLVSWKGRVSQVELTSSLKSRCKFKCAKNLKGSF